MARSEYNQAVSDFADYARRRLNAVHEEIVENIKRNGPDDLKDFYKLCGQRDALSDLLEQSYKLVQPE